MDPREAPLSIPTRRGHVETTRDALRIFEACFNGTLPFCSCRPLDRKRKELIVSGNVFVYDEASSGIRRWTDGIDWSPSRILTNFLIYRQLHGPFPRGEKKRARKGSGRPLRPGEPYLCSASSAAKSSTDKDVPLSSPDSPIEQGKGQESRVNTVSRRLVGSLVDSYGFKDNGLLKKTMTVTVNGLPYHLIAYYSINDAECCLKTPRDDSRLKNLWVRDALLNQSKFVSSNLDDTGDGNFDQTKSFQGLYPDHCQNEYDPSQRYATLPHNFYQIQLSRPFPCQGVYASAHPPPAHTGSADRVPYATTAAFHQPSSAPALYAVAAALKRRQS